MTNIFVDTEIGADGNPRRPHRKSRYGCSVCKQRRVKCDERRSSCGNCIKSRRQCSFLDQVAALPSPAPTSVSVATTSTPEQLSGRSPSSTIPSVAARTLEEPTSQDGESYNVSHMRLWHHYLYHMSNMFYGGESLAAEHRELSVKLALASQYLMDEILALAAAHKSTLVDGSSRSFYRRESMELQTRALDRFNSDSPDIGGDNALSIFIFSSCLGQHVLFDAFSDLTDLPTVLDRFVGCLKLHRGIRTIVGSSFHLILAQLREQHSPNLAMGHEMLAMSTTDKPGDECSALVTLIQETDLRPVEEKAYEHAVAALQKMFDNLRNADASSHIERSAVQEWPVRVSVDYVNLLAQRRPEALIILAYYAMLLHKARSYWAVAGAGRFLIQSITAHLGPYWAEWLDMPNKMLEDSEPDHD